MQIYTSRYGNSRSIKQVDAVPIRTSVGAPRASFHYETVLDLAPSRSWLGLPHDVYLPKYQMKLAALGPDRIRWLLDIAGGGRDVILLCYENLLKPGEWCHRRMFADWWAAQTGESVLELEDRVPKKQGNVLGHPVSKSVREKASRLIAQGKVEYLGDGRWRVQGDTAAYDVTDESCSCPTGPELLCSHRLAILMRDGTGQLFP